MCLHLCGVEPLLELYMKEVVGVEARFLKMEVVGICEGWWIWLLTFGTPRKMC